jgi:uncharacterized membrane-anchored protein
MVLAHLSLLEVAVRTGLKVLMKVDYKSVMIVGDPQGILGQQLRTHPIYYLILL